MTTKHTPGPWRVGMKPGPMVYGPQGEQIVGINVLLDQPEVTANAQFIVRACNAHADLLAALEALVSEALSMNADLRKIGKGRPEDGAHPDCPIDAACAAIAKARGEA